MGYKLTPEKRSALDVFTEQLIRNPDKYPDNMMVLSFTDAEMTQIFTRRRLELIRTIQEKKPKNVSGLSEIVGRRVSAVLRDLKLLKGQGILELKKDGKNVIPRVAKNLVIIPAIELKPKTLDELKAKA